MFFISPHNRIHKIISSMTVASMLFVSLSQPASAAPFSQTFEERVLSSWNSARTRISLQGLRMSLEDVDEAYYNLLFSHPEYFFVASNFSYGANDDSNIQEIYAEYICSPRQIPSMKKKYADKIEEIVSECRPEWSDAQKIFYFHDYLCANCKYDTALEKYDAYSLLIDGSAVCQGYSLAMNSLCQAVGIPCYCLGTIEQEHMWNVVQVDGEWYHLDATFDDACPDIPGQCLHNYILRSDAFMNEDYSHMATDWKIYAKDVNIQCVSEKYNNAFWIDSIDAAEVLEDGSMLMNLQTHPKDCDNLSEAGASTILIRCEDDGTMTTEKLLSTNCYWLSPFNIPYTYCFCYCDAYHDRFYFTTSEQIISADMKGGNKRIEYSLTDEELQLGHIFGLSIDDSGVLSYQIAELSEYDYTTGYLPSVIHSFQIKEEQPPIIDTTTTTTTTTTETISTTTTTSTTSNTTEFTSTTSSETTTTSIEPIQITTESVPPIQPLLIGDVNGDGKVKISDAILLCRYISEAEKITITPQGLSNADCNGDTLLNYDDATLILKLIARLIFL